MLRATLWCAYLRRVLARRNIFHLCLLLHQHSSFEGFNTAFFSQNCLAALITARETIDRDPEYCALREARARRSLPIHGKWQA